MAIIKIRGRREVITVDNAKGRQVKKLRFGDVNGKGKADPHDGLDLGDDWAGEIGQVEWVEIGKDSKKPEFKIISRKDTVGMVFQVPLDYNLKEGEEFV